MHLSPESSSTRFRYHEMMIRDEGWFVFHGRYSWVSAKKAYRHQLPEAGLLYGVPVVTSRGEDVQHMGVTCKILSQRVNEASTFTFKVVTLHSTANADRTFDFLIRICCRWEIEAR
jgi:hypothetical protein